MVDLGFDLNVDSVEDLSAFEILPKGAYKAMAVETGTHTSNGGEQLYFAWKILEGQYENRQFRTWHNLYHEEGSKARNFAMRQLGNIGKAAGMQTVRRTEDLLHKAMNIDVIVHTYNGKESNRIQAWHKSDGTQTQVAQAPANGSSQAMPWAAGCKAGM